MRYLLLIPPIVLLGLWLASINGMVDRRIGTGSALVGSAYWVLMFLICHGAVRGWRVTRAFIVAFVVFNFAAVFYAQLQDSTSLGSVGLNLMGAAVISWLFTVLYWPAKRQRRKIDAQPDRRK